MAHHIFISRPGLALAHLETARSPTILAWEYRCFSPMLNPGGENSVMAHDLERLKQRIALLEHLQRHNWKPCRAGTRQELIGLCPLHQEVRPSFYVNAHKNLFYCHGCGRGGDLIRFVQLFLNLPFRQSVAHLEQELMPAPASQLLEQTLAFYQLQLHRHSEAVRYLEYRGLHDPTIIEGLGIGYAPGGNLRRHLAGWGYPFDLLFDTGLINRHSRDAFSRRIIFPAVRLAGLSTCTVAVLAQPSRTACCHAPRVAWLPGSQSAISQRLSWSKACSTWQCCGRRAFATPPARLAPT
jgi:hypothetical protein